MSGFCWTWSFKRVNRVSASPLANTRQFYLPTEPARVHQGAFIVGKGEIELEAMVAVTAGVAVDKNELDQGHRCARSDVHSGAEGTVVFVEIDSSDLQQTQKKLVGHGAFRLLRMCVVLLTWSQIFVFKISYEQRYGSKYYVNDGRG